MTTVFGKLGDELYDALLEPDAARRRIALEEWANRAAEAMSKEVRAEIGSYLVYLTEGRWTDEGWQMGERQMAANKVRENRRRRHLTMEVKLQSLGVKPETPLRLVEFQEPMVPGPKSEGAKHQLWLESEVRAIQNPRQAEYAAVPQGAGIPVRTADTRADDDDAPEEDTGRSPNDDRSDSMNSNNDAHQAAMDNHANQLNPDHSAYWSSRGH